MTETQGMNTQQLISVSETGPSSQLSDKPVEGDVAATQEDQVSTKDQPESTNQAGQAKQEPQSDDENQDGSVQNQNTTPKEPKTVDQLEEQIASDAEPITSDELDQLYDAWYKDSNGAISMVQTPEEAFEVAAMIDAKEHGTDPEKSKSKLRSVLEFLAGQGAQALRDLEAAQKTSDSKVFFDLLLSPNFNERYGGGGGIGRERGGNTDTISKSEFEDKFKNKPQEFAKILSNPDVLRAFDQSKIHLTSEQKRVLYEFAVGESVSSESLAQFNGIVKDLAHTFFSEEHGAEKWNVFSKVMPQATFRSLSNPVFDENVRLMFKDFNENPQKLQQFFAVETTSSTTPVTEQSQTTELPQAA